MLLSLELSGETDLQAILWLAMLALYAVQGCVAMSQTRVSLRLLRDGS